MESNLENENSFKRGQSGVVSVLTISVCEWLKRVQGTFSPINSAPLLYVIRTLIVGRLYVCIRLMGYLTSMQFDKTDGIT